MTRTRWWRRAVAGAMVLGAIGLVAAEIMTSRLQAALFSGVARGLDYVEAPGPSPRIRFPAGGPYDRRLGYADLPSFIQRLGLRGYGIEGQAQLSERHLAAIDRGVFPIYREKTQTGLSLLDRKGEALFAARFPERIYPDFAAVPALVVDTLLFIENRELLEPGASTRNPAIEWDRLLAVVPGALAQLAKPELKVPGGSTLATQIEKYRHSPDGRTDHVREKLRQLVSASLRAYRDGPDTQVVRRQIVVDYLNSTPLSARPGFGEVIGLGDGLFAWFGADFALVNEVLRQPAIGVEQRSAQAQIYKQALALLLAQRRPSYYLVAGQQALDALADRYLRLLRDGGVIDPELAEAALAQPLTFVPEAPTPARVPFVDQKAANAIRAELLDLLGLRGFYPLDRLDLSVETSLDLPAQQRVTSLLQQLADPAVAQDLGLYGYRLLDAGRASRTPTVSFTLYERGAGVNYLRVQTDNLDQPFDLNRGAKLDLGSTAKLRTLITYLEIVADLHARLSRAEAGEGRKLAAAAVDPLTRWAADYLGSKGEVSLEAMLDAAMARTYSASPRERFFTGGGSHQFTNFDADDNGRVLSVAMAFRHSVNLVFIRLMRDIVRYYEGQGTPAAAILGAPDHPLRRSYLARFADREGVTFLNQFYGEFVGFSPDQALDRVASATRPRAERLAVIFRSVRPAAERAAFDAFLRGRLPDQRLSERELARLYEAYALDKFPLVDRAYIAKVHPLKLWLAAYWQEHASPTRAVMLEAGAAARQDSYAWLFKTGSKAKQDQRIRILLEEDAFARIHEAWRRLGYPFETLVPSYATAIGSSADRPEALAELIGTILNDGVWQPTVRVQRLHFAEGAPYETVLGLEPKSPAKVLAPEIAAVVRRALVDVVDAGTAVRLRGAYRTEAGAPLPIGAKTGTGDHRRKSFAAGGRLTGSEVVSRTATVVFFIGEQLFGNLTVYVPGPEAANFSFTSSLPAQLLKGLAPALGPLLDYHDLRTADAADAVGGG